MSPSATEFAAVLGSIAFMLMIAVNLQRLWQGLRGRPTTAELQNQIHREYATAEALATHASGDAGRFAQVDGHVTALSTRITTIAESVRAEMHELELRLMKAGDERAGKIHSRLDEVVSRIADLANGTAFRNRRS